MTDTSGLYAQALTQLTVNGLPTQPTVSISPTPAYTSDSLIASATGSIDPEGSMVVYSYEWLLNGAASGYTGPSLPSSATNRGEVWTSIVTPSDGTGFGTYGAESVTIENAIPTVSNVLISPAIQVHKTC